MRGSRGCDRRDMTGKGGEVCGGIVDSELWKGNREVISRGREEGRQIIISKT